MCVCVCEIVSDFCLRHCLARMHMLINAVHLNIHARTHAHTYTNTFNSRSVLIKPLPLCMFVWNYCFNLAASEGPEGYKLNINANAPSHCSSLHSNRSVCLQINGRTVSFLMSKRGKLELQSCHSTPKAAVWQLDEILNRHMITSSFTVN